MSGYEWFAPVYDTWAADMTEDVDFYVELAREAEGPIIELAAGSGRIAIPIAQRTGKRVIGIDLSIAMLDIPRTRAAEAGVDVELHEATCAKLGSNRQRSRICPYRALPHLPTWRDGDVFERVARALRPGGRFAGNAFVRPSRRRRV
jgi:ubiquinone/menaquinone biosynthesis C-methylase UbiE